jgi:hypothetical protein
VKDVAAFFILAGIFIAVGFFMGGFVGSCSMEHDTNRKWQAEVVKRGHGQFIITDSLSGATKFQWRSPDGK